MSPARAAARTTSNTLSFGDKHRLAIQKDGHTTIYDSGDHRVSGVQQQQGSSSSLAFTSQHGTVNLDELKAA